MPKNQSQFSIHINEFDGPLELLLHLIKQSKMNIYDIQIESITTQYVEYLDKMKAFNIDLVSEYFVMASNLMAIKSKLLLPANTEDDEDETDPRNELVNQLIVYQVYKKHAGDLQHRYQERAKLHSRAEVVPNYMNGLIDNHDPLNLGLLKQAFQRVISNQKPDVDTPVEVNEWQYSVEEQAEWLIHQLSQTSELDLEAVFQQQADLEALITTFLALLEMIKQNQIQVRTVDQRIKILKQLGDNDEQ